MKFLKASILIGFLALLSKLLGLARVLVFANRLGAGQEFDIYVAAFRLPDFIFNLLILGTLSVAFIPVFVEYLNRDPEEAAKISSTIFNLTFLVMGVFAALGILLSRFVVKIIVPGFDAEAQAQTAALTRILMLSPLLFSLSSVLTSILHSFKRFVIVAIAPLFYNLAIIFGALVLYPSFGLSGIAWGVVLGAFLHFVLQIPSAVRLGFRPFRYFTLSHAGVSQIARLFLPRVLGMDLGQVSLLIASVLGSYLASGALAVFYIAYDLETVPLGVFALSFAIAAFPALSEFAAKKDIAGFKKFFSGTAVQILFLMIPISVLMLLLRAQIVRLIPGALQGTKFTFEDTRLTAQTLGFFTISLFAQSLVPLLSRCFYALQNTVIPVISGLLGAAVNIVLAVSLRPIGNPYIFAIAFSASVVVQMLILIAILRKKLGDLGDDVLILRVIKITVASLVMGIFAYITLYVVAPLVNMQTYLGVLIQTLSALVVALATYLLAGLIIQIPETKNLLGVLKNWFFKFTRPVTSAIVNMFTDVR